MELQIKTKTGHEVITDHDNNNYSTAQLQAIAKIGRRPDFSHFVGGAISSTIGPERKPGPFYLMYYDKAHDLHTIKLGLGGKILKEFSTNEAKIIGEITE